jgi:biotin carboxyl carrier protein
MRQQSPAPEQVFDYRVETQGETVRVNLDGDEIELAVTTKDAQEGWCRTSDGNLHSFCWTWVENSLRLWVDGNVFIYENVESRRQVNRESTGLGGDIVAPMPGRVVQVLVQVGDAVQRGQTLIILESMKMELEIAAPRDGVVKRIPVEPGAQVDKGMRLVELEEQ